MARALQRSFAAIEAERDHTTAILDQMTDAVLTLSQAKVKQAPAHSRRRGAARWVVLAVLIVLPVVFGITQRNASRGSGYRHPDDELASA